MWFDTIFELDILFQQKKTTVCSGRVTEYEWNIFILWVSSESLICYTNHFIKHESLLKDSIT